MIILLHIGSCTIMSHVTHVLNFSGKPDKIFNESAFTVFMIWIWSRHAIPAPDVQNWAQTPKKKLTAE